MHTKKKSLVVFVIVVAALGLSGWWLDSQGRLDMPRIGSLPSALTGEERANFGPGEGRVPPGNMASAAAGTDSAATGTDSAAASTDSAATGTDSAATGPTGEAMGPGGFGEREGGERGGDMAGLSVNNVLDVLSNVWFIGVMIVIVVGLSRLCRLSRWSVRSAGGVS